MKLDLITRAELAKELKICTATLDIWRKKYKESNNKLLPGEVHLGDKAKTIRFKKSTVLNHFLEKA